MPDLSAEERIAGHCRRNAKLIDNLKSDGIDLDCARSIELHFWANSQDTAVQLARSFYERGMLVLQLSPAVDAQEAELWNVEAGIRKSIREVVDRAFTTELVLMANEHKCAYDGWGTAI